MIKIKNSLVSNFEPFLDMPVYKKIANRPKLSNNNIINVLKTKNFIELATPLGRKSLLKKRKTVRNTKKGFKPDVALKFQKILNYRDLPIIFNLKKYKLLRYTATFFGYNYNRKVAAYNL